MIADMTALPTSKERDLAYQVERVWCDDEDITEGCFYFDTDANIALCYDRNEQGERFRHPGEAEDAKIIKIGKIKYQLRKGEYRTYADYREEMKDYLITTEEVQTITRDEYKMITVDRILVDASKGMTEVGYLADKVLPLLPVNDPKDPDIATMSFKDDTEVKWNGDMTLTFTLPSTLLRWKDDDDKEPENGLRYFIANTVA